MESDGERGDSNVGSYAHSMACSLSNLSLESSELGEIRWRERVSRRNQEGLSWWLRNFSTTTSL